MQNLICLMFNSIIGVTRNNNNVKESKKVVSITTTINNNNNEEDDDDVCCVCLSRLTKEGEDIKVLPCLHHFHSKCVDKWFTARRKTCPICRFLVEDDDTLIIKEEEANREMMVIWYSSFHVTGLSGIF